MAVTDGRRLRGDRTRQRVAVRAAELASVHGLSGLTIGQLADDLEISKSSVAAVFGTKEQLQLAAIDAARRIFVAEIVERTAGEPPGVARLTSLADAWFDYVAKPVFPGGCFMVATASEYDSRPGAVRDALSGLRREWIGLLAHHVGVAQANGGLTDLPPSTVAFEIDALLSYAGVTARLLDDPTYIETARSLIRRRLAG